MVTQNLHADFTFGECSGHDTFQQQINLNQDIFVGSIPKGIKGLHVELISDKDVDIRLYKSETGYKVVHWPDGILSGANKETKDYLGVPITYSGYNGVDGDSGHEFIDVYGTTPVKFTLKAFGYQAGNATVNYSWTDKEGCTPGKGEGNFEQLVKKNAITTVGEIRAGIENLNVELTSDKDVDIQLYGEDGTAIVQWPNGLMNGSNKQEIDYHGMIIKWSGYNGTNGNRGNEYIKVIPIATEKITMKVFGYQAGTAHVHYTWGFNGNNSDCITKKELKEKIKNNEDVTQVNTSCITDMSGLFEGFEIVSYNYPYPHTVQYPASINPNFNQDISGWDVSHVTNMNNMFFMTTSFNQHIGNWNVSKVTDMHKMFYEASSFNQPVKDWNVSKVTDMSFMFNGAYNFNQDISSWNVSNVTNMSDMFNLAREFNQPLGDWNVSKVTDMVRMFKQTYSFNQDISSWDVSHVTNMLEMFGAATIFNQPLGDWNVSNVTNIRGMFFETGSFNQPIGNWDVSNVTDMSGIFSNATSFNQPIGNWNVSNVTDMGTMFFGTKSFNQPIGSWDVSNVTDMGNMFSNAESFNQPIGDWNVSNVTDMYGMFERAVNFDQPLGEWNVSNVTNHSNFSDGSALQDNHKPHF